MRKYCYALDLKNDPKLIREYEEYHKQVWPEILISIKESGIIDAEIYRVENRLFMITEVNDDFSFEKKRKMDNENEKVQKWENLMWKYQQTLPGTKDSEKWRLMERIFKL